MGGPICSAHARFVIICSRAGPEVFCTDLGEVEEGASASSSEGGGQESCVEEAHWQARRFSPIDGSSQWCGFNDIWRRGHGAVFGFGLGFIDSPPGAGCG